MRRALVAVLRGALVTAVFIAAAEGILRVLYAARTARVEAVAIPYLITHNYGPIPPWMDRLRIIDWDTSTSLTWKLRPNVRRRYIDVFAPVRVDDERTAMLRQFSPSVPPALKDSPVWEIALNSSGYRDREFPAAEAEGTLRVLCIGDSWTFGTNVGQDQAYPQRLEALLRERFPGAPVEVFNLGVPGYSSHQGLELLRQTAPRYAPDVVVIGFAMNDASVAGYRDRDVPRSGKSPKLRKRIVRVLNHSETAKLLLYAILRVRYVSTSIGEHLQRLAEHAGSSRAMWWGSELTTPVDYAANEPWTRVPPGHFAENVGEMIRLTRGHGADPILLYNHLWPTPYRAVLDSLSRAEGVAFLDAQAVIVDARRRMEDELEARLDLRPAPTGRREGEAAPDSIPVVFRVYSGEHAVPKAIYIAGAHPRLGNAVPNTVAMFDDGSHGDQRAGDRVWSLRATFAPGVKLFYVYTNSGRQGRWEGLDVPQVRGFTVDAPGATGVHYRPIESFGRMYMQADGWHTDAGGYDLIARELLGIVSKHPRLRGDAAPTLAQAR